MTYSFFPFSVDLTARACQQWLYTIKHFIKASSVHQMTRRGQSHLPLAALHRNMTKRACRKTNLRTNTNSEDCCRTWAVIQQHWKLQLKNQQLPQAHKSLKSFWQCTADLLHSVDQCSSATNFTFFRNVIMTIKMLNFSCRGQFYKFDELLFSEKHVCY